MSVPWRMWWCPPRWFLGSHVEATVIGLLWRSKVGDLEAEPYFDGQWEGYKNAALLRSLGPRMPRTGRGTSEYALWRMPLF